MARRPVSLVGRNGFGSNGIRKVTLGARNGSKLKRGAGGPRLGRAKVNLLGREASTARVRRAIRQATSVAEIDRIERQVKSGKLPQTLGNKGKAKGKGKSKGMGMKGSTGGDEPWGKGKEGKGKGKGKGLPPKGNSDGVWRHDLFQKTQGSEFTREPEMDTGPYSMGGIKGRGRKGAGKDLDDDMPWEGRKGAGNSKGKGKGGGAAVTIENLEHGIMADDLEELFGSVGKVQKAWVNYDPTDRSDGTGGCLFDSAWDAKRAIEQYDGTIVEGMQIRIRMDTSKGTGKDGGGKGGGGKGDRGRSRGRSRAASRARSRGRSRSRSMF